MLRPYVTISPFVRPHTTVLYLRIENSGKTAAEDLHLSMDKDFFQFGEAKQPARNLRAMKAFVEPIKSLPPGGKLIFALGQGFIILAETADQAAVPTQFAVTAAYHFGVKKISEVNHVDLRPFVGSEGERDPLVDELEKIRELLERQK
jgi:hypothetical protein